MAGSDLLCSFSPPRPLLQPFLPPLPPPGLGADATEEFDHGVGAEIGGDAGADVELGVHLDEVEADHLRARGMFEPVAPDPDQARRTAPTAG